MLWASDKMVGGTSAYSKVTYECCTRLVKLGYKIAHIPMGRANRMGKQVYEGVLVYPSGNNPFAEDVMLKHYINYSADMLIVLKETWCLSTIYEQAINFVPYCAIDHSPVSSSITSRMHTAFKILTPSRFGQRELKTAEINATYLPHGVRTDRYKPLTGHRAECKRLWFLDEDDFTVLIVARNQSRKMIPHMLRAFKLFKERNPDVKTHLFLWTDMQPRQSEVYEGAVGIGVSDVGVNLLPEVMRLDLGEDVIWPDPKLIRMGIPEWAGPNYKAGWDMVKLYNCADTILLLSGEGAGLPLLEGASCGVTGVCVDYASAPEYVGSGLAVPMKDYVILNTPGTRYPIADLDKAADALTAIMNADREKLARKARAFALRYDWQNIVNDYWKPFLEECEEQLYPLYSKEGIKSWA